MNSGFNFGVTLRVSGPKDDDLVKLVSLLEIENILTNLLDLIRLGAWDDIISTIRLI